VVAKGCCSKQFHAFQCHRNAVTGFWCWSQYTPGSVAYAQCRTRQICIFTSSTSCSAQGVKPFSHILSAPAFHPAGVPSASVRQTGLASFMIETDGNDDPSWTRLLHFTTVFRRTRPAAQSGCYPMREKTGISIRSSRVESDSLQSRMCAQRDPGPFLIRMARDCCEFGVRDALT